MNRGASRITASPVMIGALTVIITVLAVFLAYNANSGLPFTPTYKISSQVENANTLVAGQRGPHRRRPRRPDRGDRAGRKRGRDSRTRSSTSSSTPRSSRCRSTRP